jgi:hypothetical protein
MIFNLDADVSLDTKDIELLEVCIGGTDEYVKSALAERRQAALQERYYKKLAKAEQRRREMEVKNKITFEDLKGETITKWEGEEGDDEVKITTASGLMLTLWHRQDCCESVYLSDLAGDVEDIIGVPVFNAEESSEDGKDSDTYASSTWTFYRIITEKGMVVLRWVGRSNGYYSERVDMKWSKVNDSH